VDGLFPGCVSVGSVSFPNQPVVSIDAWIGFREGLLELGMDSLPVYRHWGWYTLGFLAGCVAAGAYLGHRRERYWQKHGVGLRVPRQSPLFYFGEDRASKEYWLRQGEKGGGGLAREVTGGRPPA
jgi:hypothetical protein